MKNEIVLTERECVIKDTGDKVRYISIDWHIGANVIQLKPVFKNDKSTIKALTMVPDIKFVPYKGE